MAYIDDLRAELASVRAAIKDVIEAGQSYSVSGSHNVTLANLNDLRERESELKGLILARHYQVGGGRYARFSL